MPVELVIGVVGLAVQIIEASSKIKEIIRTLKDAPREIQRLALKIDHAESMCRHIKHLFEQEDGVDSQAASLNEAIGEPILRSINATLDELSEIVLKVQRKGGGKGSLSLKSTGWAWLDKKDRVQRLTGELESDLTILTQTITSNIYSNVKVIQQQLIVQPAIVQTRSDATDVANSPSTTSKVAELAIGNMINPSGQLGPAYVTKTEESIKIYEWLFSVKIKHQKNSKKTRWNERIETDTVSETKSVTFSHPYLDRQLRFTYRFGSLCQPSYALTVPHVIDLRAPSWKAMGQKLDSAIQQDDIKAIQEMFSACQLTPRTKFKGMRVGDDDEGGTLFEHAMVYLKSDLCHFLGGQSQSVDVDRVDWPRSGIYIAPRFEKRTFEGILYLLAPSYHSCDPISLFNFLAKPHVSPDYILSCYNFCRPQAINRHSELVQAAVCLCIANWRAGMPLDAPAINEWVALLIRLKDDGLELHARVSEVFKYEDERWMEDSFSGFLFFLRRAMQLRSNQWEAMLFEWLKVIDGCNIDIKEYLEVETAACKEAEAEEARRNSIYDWEGWDAHHCVKVVPIVRSVYGLEIPTFAPQYAREGPANDICLEFSGLCISWGTNHRIGYSTLEHIIMPEKPRAHRNWKISVDWTATQLWPFATGIRTAVDLDFVPWPSDDESWVTEEWRRSFTHTIKAEKAIVSSFKYAEELRDQRFQRRQRKQLCKMGLEEWPRKGKRAMPGAWVDDGH